MKSVWHGWFEHDGGFWKDVGHARCVSLVLFVLWLRGL